MITPLADGVKRRWDKEGIAGDDLERLNGTIRGDDGVEFDAAFVASVDGQRRIYRVHAINKLSHLLKFADFVTLDGWLKDFTLRSSGARNGANQAGRRITAGNSSRNGICAVFFLLMRWQRIMPHNRWSYARRCAETAKSARMWIASGG